MAGWLTLMIVIAVAGREAARELSVFQIMLMRSVLGMAMLWPLVHAAGGLAAMRTARLPQHALRNTVHYAAQYGWFVALILAGNVLNLVRWPLGGGWSRRRA